MPDDRRRARPKIERSWSAVPAESRGLLAVNNTLGRIRASNSRTPNNPPVPRPGPLVSGKYQPIQNQQTGPTPDSPVPPPEQETTFSATQMKEMMKEMATAFITFLTQALQTHSQNQNQGAGPSQFRPPNLDTEYSGEPNQKPPGEWLQKAEMQYKAHNLPQNQWVVSAVPFLRGIALDWYLSSFLEKVPDESDWSAFKAGLQQAYIGADPQIQGMQMVTSLSLQNCKGNLSAYIARFQNAITQMGQQAPTQKFQCFLFQQGLDLESRTATACNPQTGAAFESVDALIRVAQAYQQAKAPAQTQTNQNQDTRCRDALTRKRPAPQPPLAARTPAKAQTQNTAMKPQASEASSQNAAHPPKKFRPVGQPGPGLQSPSEFAEIMPGHMKGAPDCKYTKVNTESPLPSSHENQPILPHHFRDIEQLCGNKFTVHASSPDALDASQIANEHIWMKPRIDRISECLEHYLQIKSQNPHALSACILMPKWARRRPASKMKNMRLIKEFQKNSPVFGGSDLADSEQIIELKHCPWPIQIYYDPPRPHICCVNNKSFMSGVAGTLSGSSANFHLDTLAAENFVSVNFARQIGLALEKHQQQIILADGTGFKTHGIGTYKIFS